MALLNYTTTVAADVSVGQISKALSMAGARRVMHEYDNTGAIVALSFQMELDNKPIGFRLPTDWRPVLETMRQQKLERVRGHGDIKLSEDQARRVSWRITKDWVEAQLAFIETQMVSTVQVFLPYAVTNKGQTLYEQLAKDPSLLLGEGDD